MGGDNYQSSIIATTVASQYVTNVLFVAFHVTSLALQGQTVSKRTAQATLPREPSYLLYFMMLPSSTHIHIVACLILLFPLFPHALPACTRELPPLIVSMNQYTSAVFHFERTQLLTSAKLQNNQRFASAGENSLNMH